MFKGQLELSLANHRAARAACRPRRSARARWWFDRMRQVVDAAADYPAAPEAQASPTATILAR